MSDKMTEIDVKKPTNRWQTRMREKWHSRWHLYIIFVVSIMGFCYQFRQSLTNYWDYKTTVTFTQEMPNNYQYQYPAITVCYKEIVPHFLLEDVFPEYKKAVEQIRNQSRRRSDPDFWTKRISKVYNDEKLTGKDLFLYFKEKLVSKTKVLDLLEKYSYGQEYDCVLDALPAVKDKIDQCRKVVKPIETINGDFRCFTYMSQLDIVMNNQNLFKTTIFSTHTNFERRTNKVVYISHKFNISKMVHPFDNYFKVRAMIHSPNQLPVPLFYPSILLTDWSRFYDIEFWKTISYLQPKPYETNCFSYKTGTNESFQSFNDCVNKCLMTKHRENCRCLPRSGVLYRRSELLPTDKFCPKITHKCAFTNYRLECEKGCQKDCLQEKYSFEKYTELPFISNQTGLQISRKPVMDQVYRHDPSITFIQLISDFGGLAGLWLEFSVITITTAIIQLITKPLEKRSN